MSILLTRVDRVSINFVVTPKEAFLTHKINHLVRFIVNHDNPIVTNWRISKENSTPHLK